MPTPKILVKNLSVEFLATENWHLRRASKEFTIACTHVFPTLTKIPERMAPTPEKQVPVVIPASPRQDGEEVVISGMSGAYPQCTNIKELSDILYNGVSIF